MSSEGAGVAAWQESDTTDLFMLLQASGCIAGFGTP